MTKQTNNSLDINQSLLESETLIQREEYALAIRSLQYIEAYLEAHNAIKHQAMMLQILSIYERMKTLKENNILSLEYILLCYKFGKLEEAETLIKTYHQKNSKDLNIFLDDLKKLNDKEQQIIFNLLGHSYYSEDMLFALFFFEKELEVNPESANAHHAISELNFRQGNIDKAIEHIKTSITIEPENISASDNLIMMLHYTNSVSLEEIYQESLKYLPRCFPQIQNIKLAPEHFRHLDLSPSRNLLRVGFVSGDFRKHALYYWLKDFLKDLNFPALEIFLYQNASEDTHSEEYKSQVKNWRNISGLNDTEAFTLVQEDKIDVLVDLSGHTSLNRLGLFALKPSPLQITWLGQSGPMGLPQIDYMLVDENQVKIDEEQFFTEKVERLNGFIAPYSFTEKDAHKNLLREIPFWKNGYISLGSANGLTKMNHEVLMTWSEILKKIPKSKLYLKNKCLADTRIQDRIMSLFTKEGIDSERIIIKGFEERDSYLNFYNQLDFALDPFPIGGGTTSLDTLSMGVPILTIYGQHLGHRFTSCMNKSLRLDDLICLSRKEYIDKAVALASNPEKIQTLRNHIIDNFKHSEICDIKNFVNKFEKTIYSLWEKKSQNWSGIQNSSRQELFYSLCSAYHDAEKNKNLDELKKCSEQLQEIFPEQDTSWFYSSLASLEEGELDKALVELKKALAIAPDNKSYNNNLIMLSHYSDQVSKAEMLDFAQNYYKYFVEKVIADSQKDFKFSKLISDFKTQKPKIKVGFVSGDIKMHPIFFWISSLIDFLPNSEFEIYIYANNQVNDFAESLKNSCSKLTYVDSLSPQALADKIHEEQIHILIDLSGHTAFNKLETFALKPAPLQMTWLGQSGPMGIPQIDYMITDPWLVKPEESQFYTEKICKMPHLFASYPANSYSNLLINRSLARTDGGIVLGSFNHSLKINRNVLETWSEILQEVPNSYLLIKNMSVETSYYRNKILNFFKSKSIDESRILLEGRTDKSHYLSSFSRIDIALDPFPFGGGTTTHETLMMSVPIVSLFGDRSAHRGSSAILYASGLSELVTHSKEEYKTKIIKLASNPNQIIEYKNSIREKYLNSPATNMQEFSKDFFNTLKKLWDEKLNA
jgi:predicted O-linked N-acetylglucosamine transferase (SPINDLY family)